VEKRLFLPEGWLTDTEAARRARGNVPPALALQSTPPWAAAMVQASVRAGLLPFTSGVADGLDGTRPDFLDAIDTCVGGTAFVAMPAETRGWLQRPQTAEKAYP